MGLPDMRLCTFADARGNVCGKFNGADVHYHGKGPPCPDAPKLNCHRFQPAHAANCDTQTDPAFTCNCMHAGQAKRGEG